KALTVKGAKNAKKNQRGSLAPAVERPRGRASFEQVFRRCLRRAPDHFGSIKDVIAKEKPGGEGEPPGQVWEPVRRVSSYARGSCAHSGACRRSSHTATNHRRR